MKSKITSGTSNRPLCDCVPAIADAAPPRVRKSDQRIVTESAAGRPMRRSVGGGDGPTTSGYPNVVVPVERIGNKSERCVTPRFLFEANQLVQHPNSSTVRYKNDYQHSEEHVRSDHAFRTSENSGHEENYYCYRQAVGECRSADIYFLSARRCPIQRQFFHQLYMAIGAAPESGAIFHAAVSQYTAGIVSHGLARAKRCLMPRHTVHEMNGTGAGKNPKADPSRRLPKTGRRVRDDRLFGGRPREWVFGGDDASRDPHPSRKPRRIGTRKTLAVLRF